MEKISLIKMLNVCSSKDTMRKTKMQPTDGEKLFANLVFDKNIQNMYFGKYMYRQLNTKTIQFFK